MKLMFRRRNGEPDLFRRSEPIYFILDDNGEFLGVDYPTLEEAEDARRELVETHPASSLSFPIVEWWGV
jgi:hypothetical protein